MSNNNTNISELSRRYAKALFALSKSSSELTNHFHSFQKILDLKNINNDFLIFLKNPLISSKKKIEIFNKILTKLEISDTFCNFLKIVAQHNKLVIIENIFLHFKKMIEEKNNQTTVSIISISPLEDVLKKELSKKLENITGKKIIVINQIDKNIIGGIIIKINSVMIDFSIKTKLENYQFSLKGTV